LENFFLRQKNKLECLSLRKLFLPSLKSGERERKKGSIREKREKEKEEKGNVRKKRENEKVEKWNVRKKRGKEKEEKGNLS
jgi:hypothetical protein